MDWMAVSEARSEFSTTLERVIRTGNRIVLRRHGREVAALVPIEDLHLLEELENRMDLEAARAALREPGAVPYEEVRKKLGL